jgi:hypothetical protein
MMAFLYENFEYVAIFLGVLLGMMLIALYNRKMSSYPQSKWAPAMPMMVATSTKTAIISIIVLLIVLVGVCIGGILDHQSTRLVGGMIVGTLIMALTYWCVGVLLTRLLRLISSIK